MEAVTNDPYRSVQHSTLWLYKQRTSAICLISGIIIFIWILASRMDYRVAAFLFLAYALCTSVILYQHEQAHRAILNYKNSVREGGDCGYCHRVGYIRDPEIGLSFLLRGFRRTPITRCPVCEGITPDKQIHHPTIYNHVLFLIDATELADMAESQGVDPVVIRHIRDSVSSDVAVRVALQELSESTRDTIPELSGQALHLTPYLTANT